MNYNRKKITALTNTLLEEADCKRVPVPIHKVAEKIGVEVKAYDLGENVSGVLVIKNGLGTIGYSPFESEVRQRFTIAHELGHYIMHKEPEGLFVDNSFKILFRNQASSQGDIKKEQEANAFAAAILMPEELIIEAINTYQSFDPTDERALKGLSKLFQVSVPAMSYRIANLNLF